MFRRGKCRPPIPIQDTNQAHFNVNAPPWCGAQINLSFSRQGLNPGFGIAGAGCELFYTRCRGVPRTRSGGCFFIAAALIALSGAFTQALASADGPSPRPLASKPLGPPARRASPCGACTPLPLAPEHSGGGARPPRPAVGTCSPRGASRKTAAWDAGWRTAYTSFRRRPAGREDRRGGGSGVCISCSDARLSKPARALRGMSTPSPPPLF